MRISYMSEIVVFTFELSARAWMYQCASKHNQTLISIRYELQHHQ